MSIHWIMETSHLDGADHHLWTVEIKGLPGVRITIDLQNPEDYPFKTGPERLALAAPVVNSIPGVYRAAPGVMETSVANHFRVRFDP